MSAPAAGLRPFFQWLERNGGATVAESAFHAALGANKGAIATALTRASILRGAAPATTLPCGEGHGDCAREVRVLEPASARGKARVLAVCGREPRECATEEIDGASLAQITISVAELARAVRELLGIEHAGAASKNASADPLHVGEQARESGVRDVVLFVRRPRAQSLATWLEARERAARPTLVLVPTVQSAPAELRARHGRGAHVELDVLSDALIMRDGALALAPRLHVVRTEPALPPQSSGKEHAPREATVRPLGAARAIPKAASWHDVRITLVDGETIMVDIGGRYQRLTYVDLGLAGKSNRKPVKAWVLLVACCEGQGQFRWKQLGTFENARQVVARLRKAMRAAFAIEEDPFHEFSWEVQWRTRFRAGVEG